MNIYCIGYNNNKVFGCDFVFNNKFEVEAGSSDDFTDDLYKSLNDYLDGSITLDELIDDIELEFGYRPTLVMPSDTIADDIAEMEEDEKEKIFSSMIKVGNVNNSCCFLPINMCEYVL